MRVSRGSFYGLGAAGYGRGGGTAPGHGHDAAMGMGYNNNNANANGFQLSGYGGQVNGAGGGDFGGFGGVKQAETQPVYNFSGNRGRGGPMRSSGVHTPAMTVSTGSPPNNANVVNNNGTSARQQQQYEGVQTQLRPEVVTHTANVPYGYGTIGTPMGNGNVNMAVNKPPLPMDVPSENDQHRLEEFNGDDNLPPPANLTNYPMRKQNSSGLSGSHGYDSGKVFNANGGAQVDHTASMAVGSISTRANANVAGEDVAMVKELFEEIGHICANMATVYGKLAKVFGERIVENGRH